MCNVNKTGLTPLHRRVRAARAQSMVAALIASIVSIGCTVGPDYRRPLPPDVASLTRQPQEGGPYREVRSDWWRAYNSPRINLLVEQAFLHNPNVEVGSANLKTAQELVNAQRGLFFPTVQAGLSTSRQDSGAILASPLSTNQSIFNLHTAQVTVGFVPDVFGGNRRQVESLQASATNQLYQLAALKVTLASNVVAAAIQERQLTEQIAIAENAIRLASDQLEKLRKLKASGYSSGLDLAQQQVSYSQTLALLPPLQKQIEQTRNLLSTLCGQLPAAQLPGGKVAEAIEAPTQLPTILPSSLVERRPDVQAAQEQLHASFAQIGVATANMLPQISLSANLAFNNNVVGGLLSNANRSWSLLGGLVQPLFAGGALRARRRATEATAEAAFAQYQTVVLTAFQNVADILYALDADGRSLLATQEIQNANEQLVLHTQMQFDEGYVSRLILLSAQQSLIQSQLNRIATNATYLGDTVALYQALGGGWRNP